MPMNRAQRRTLVEEFAVLLARQPDLARRLLVRHVDDGTGRCAGCRDQHPPAWPCVLAGLTTRAAEMEDRGIGPGRVD